MQTRSTITSQPGPPPPIPATDIPPPVHPPPQRYPQSRWPLVGDVRPCATLPVPVRGSWPWKILPKRETLCPVTPETNCEDGARKQRGTGRERQLKAEGNDSAAAAAPCRLPRSKNEQAYSVQSFLRQEPEPTKPPPPPPRQISKQPR
jgi:hypothetical protein